MSMLFWRARHWPTLLAALLLLGLLPSAARPALAAGTVTVTTAQQDQVNDNGACSLREAMQAINVPAQPFNDDCGNIPSDPVTVKFNQPGTIKLNGTVLPNVVRNIVIIGPVVIDGGNGAVFDVTPNGILTLTNLTITKAGRAVDSDGTLNVAGVSFLSNGGPSGVIGAAIFSAGKTNIAGAAFTANQTGDDGGAIHHIGSQTLSIAGSVFNGNVAKRRGGAIYASAPVVLSDSVFNGNIAKGEDPNNNGTDGDAGDDYSSMGGGALFYNPSNGAYQLKLTRIILNGNLTPKGNGGALYINGSDTLASVRDSSFNGNLAGTPPATARFGGAINNFGKLEVTHVTLLNNAVVGDGGAIANDRRAELSLSNSTLVANAASGNGAGLANSNSIGSVRPTATLRNVTLALNAAVGQGGGIFNQEGASVDLGNTIISGSDGGGLGGNCAGTINSAGHNLDSGTSCGLGGPGDQSSADAKLDAPFFNGGPLSTLLTMKPLAGSAALEAGDGALCAAAPVSNQDQTGDARPKGAICDIGALEAPAPAAGFSSTPLPPGPINVGNVVLGASGQKSFGISNTGNKSLTISAAQLGGTNPEQFALLAPLPLSVSANSSASLVVSCTPTDAPGTRTALLTLVTDAPGAETVGYNLLCQATAQPTPGFSSTPAAPGPLSFGEVNVGASGSFKLSVQESGSAPLSVNSPSLRGPNAGEFSFGGGFNLNLPDGEPPFEIDLTCTPAQPGIRSATLTIATNDPARPSVNYTLTCKGITPPTAPLTPDGTNLPASGGPFWVAASPDGQHVYVSSRDSNQLRVFERSSPTTLALRDTYVDGGQDELGTTISDMVRPRYLVISSDGANVYLATSNGNAVVAFARNVETGKLRFLHSVKEGDSYGCIPAPCDGTIDGMQDAYGLALSPDGQFLYVTGSGDSAITVLRRNLSTGAIRTRFLNNDTGAAFVQTISDPNLANGRGVVVSPDGNNVYAVSNTQDALVSLLRDPVAGTLSAPQAIRDGDTFGSPPQALVVDGLDTPVDVTISPDGGQVYVASQGDNAVALFQRDQTNKGRLGYVGRYKDGTDQIDGLAGATGLALTPDGGYLFATGGNDNALAVFERNATNGQLRFAQAVFRQPAIGPGPNPALANPVGVASAPDGRSVYVAALGDNQVVLLPFANPKPTASSLAPASAPVGSPDLTLTVHGADFVPGATVRWNNDSLPTTFVNSGQLEATVAALRLSGIGEANLRVSNPAPGGGDSNELRFTITAPEANPVPSLDELVPAGVIAGAASQTITLQGAGFLPHSKVYWNAQPRPTVYVNATTLQAKLETSDLAQPGDAALTVVNPAPGGGTSNAAAFGVAAPGSNPIPALLRISPPSANVDEATGSALTLTVYGSGFGPESQGLWNGEPRPTEYLSTEELRIIVSGADLLTAGQASVSVRNPAPGGGESNAASFTIGASGDNPLPAVEQVAAIAHNADHSYTLTLTGTGFVAGSQARWNGANRPTSVTSSTQLTLQISGADFAAGSGALSVVNPTPGGGVSEEYLYVVLRLTLPLLRR